jgi:hypothetical protein
MTSAKRQKVRRPKSLTDKYTVYAGIMENGKAIYIGGPYYDEHAQLHIDDIKGLKRLIAWLTKAILFLEQEGK